MSKKNDGGSAFPVPDVTYPNGEIQFGTNGMSLRDYFAAKALTILHKDDSVQNINDIAISSYAIADAMLKEREQ